MAMAMALKMEPTEGSETPAFRTQTPGNYPKENTLHNEHGESLKSRKYFLFYGNSFGYSFQYYCEGG
jgi:hypothetical protein